MTRTMILLLGVATGLALVGCVAGMVAGAAGTAVQAARGHPARNAHLQPTAKAACSANAAPYGSVHIIDVEQRSVDRIVVWGTVDDGRQRRSFECGFKSSITYFKLRDIHARAPVSR
jgi:hypothetical protein